MLLLLKLQGPNRQNNTTVETAGVDVGALALHWSAGDGLVVIIGNRQRSFLVTPSSRPGGGGAKSLINARMCGLLF